MQKNARLKSTRSGRIAAPVYVREPLFVRLCIGFVDNLTTILRTTFVVGAFMPLVDGGGPGLC